MNIFSLSQSIFVSILAANFAMTVAHGHAVSNNSKNHVAHQATITPEYLIANVEFKDSGRFLENLVFRQFPTLNISGSSQYTEKQFRYILKDIVDNNNLQNDVVLIVDLRGEAHLFVKNQLKSASGDSMPIAAEPLIISDKTGAEIGHDLEPQLIRAMQGLEITVKPHRFATEHEASLSGEVEVVKPFNVTIASTGIGMLETEEEMVKRVAKNIKVTSPLNLDLQKTGVNLKYVRVAIPDLSVPTREQSEQIVNAIRETEKANPGKKVWVHFHCHGGVGRTAFGLYIAEMLRSNKSLQAIDDEQTKAGGRDLLDAEHPEIGQSLESAQGVKKAITDIYDAFHEEHALKNYALSVSTIPEHKRMQSEEGLTH